MRGYNIDEYINQKFNHLTLIKNLNKIDKNNSKLALFKCDCGTIKEIVFTQVLNEEVKTCGCGQGIISEHSECIKVIHHLEKIQNSTLKNNSTGKSGISKTGNKYRARIMIDSKSVHLGYYDNIEDAIKARKEAEEKYFKPILDKYKKETE